MERDRSAAAERRGSTISRGTNEAWLDEVMKTKVQRFITTSAVLDYRCCIRRRSKKGLLFLPPFAGLPWFSPVIGLAHYQRNLRGVTGCDCVDANVKPHPAVDAFPRTSDNWMSPVR